MTVVGVHALVFTGATDPDALRDAALRARAAEFDLLELSLHAVETIDPARTRADLDAAGLQIAASRGLAPDADVSSETASVVTGGVDLLHRSIDVVADLGGRLLSGALYSAFGKAPAPVSAAGRANAVSALRDAAGHAAARGVVLGLEVCNRYETNVVNTAAQALRMLDDIGAENVVVHLDSYHMNIEEDDMARPVRLVGDRLGYVHVGENHRGYLGSGHIDFGSLFHALADIGYTGPITFESFSTAVVAAGLSNDLAVWRDLWTDGDDLARHARRFIGDAVASAARRTPEAGA